jgi:hypothetical protein
MQGAPGVGFRVRTQTPAGWDATCRRVQQLILDNKTPEAITVLERVLRVVARFDSARYELADAPRMLALVAPLAAGGRRGTPGRPEV